MFGFCPKQPSDILQIIAATGNGIHVHSFRACTIPGRSMARPGLMLTYSLGSHGVNVGEHRGHGRQMWAFQPSLLIVTFSSFSIVSPPFPHYKSSRTVRSAPLGPRTDDGAQQYLYRWDNEASCRKSGDRSKLGEKDPW